MPTWRRAELAPGTYDELISARLERLLAGLDPQLNIHRQPVAHTEAISVPPRDAQVRKQERHTPGSRSTAIDRQQKGALNSGAMRWPVQRSVLSLALVAVSAAAACGGNSMTGPTGGGGGGGGGTSHDMPLGYVSSVTLPGRTGVLFFSSLDQSGLRARLGGFEALFNLFEPRLLAQSGNATGALTMDDGTSVRLGGNSAAGNVQLSGAGGYSVTGSVSGTRLSGTVTTPFGSGSATPVLIATPWVSQRGDLLGVFEASYSMRASGYFRNTNISTGQSQRDCGYIVELTGTFSLDVRGGAGTDTGFRGEFVDAYRETSTIVPPCPQVADFSPRVVEGRKTSDFVVFNSKHIQVGFDDRPDAGAGELVRTWAFVGVLNSTTIEGRFIKSMRNVVLPSAISKHEQGYPLTEIVVTLRHR
jgi:hypothetical protein